MTSVKGNPIWYELMTPDPAGAAAFYAAVIGWNVRDAGPPGMDYRLASTPAGDVGGLIKLPDGAPMAAGWVGYVGVDDLDASLKTLDDAGGKLRMPATQIPGIGRFAMVADPQGVVFYLMQPAGEQPSPAFSPTLDGHCSWNELSTNDQPGALAFYQRLFEWTLGDAMDMGAMGKYQFIKQGDAGFGAVMTAPPGAPTGWTYYFRVADVDAAVAKTLKAGGRIVHGPSPVTGDDNIIIVTDPQGASFGLVGKRAA